MEELTVAGGHGLTEQNLEAARLAVLNVPENHRQTNATKILILKENVKEIIDSAAGDEFNYPELWAQYIELDPTARNFEDLSDETLTYYARFMVNVLFTYGPEARKLKASDPDKAWDLIMYNGILKNCIRIQTFKNTARPAYKPCYIRPTSTVGGFLLLTPKSSGLLAVDILCKMGNYVQNENRTLLTPLGGSVFSKDSIPKIMAELGKTKVEVCNMINASAQSNGHLLRDSHCSVALVCAIVAVSKIKSVDEKSQIHNKIARQYYAKDKKFDAPTFNVFAAYATSGAPSEAEYSILSKVLLEIKESRVRATVSNISLSSRQVQGN
jgi:hypothetical protein